MSASIDSRAFAIRLWNARTQKDVDWIIKQVMAAPGGCITKPVGGRENNSGIIRVSSEPMLALVERITNAIDACLELKAATSNSTAASPRIAAQQWFGVPTAGLSAMSDAERRQLAQNVSVTFEESGSAKRPTLMITDKGIGIHPDRFESTILSLNGSNKINAPYTMGTFGQGGSATFGFSSATIIISRPHASRLESQDDSVGWTVVVEYFDETTMKAPSYVYYSPTSTAGAFTLTPSLLPELEHGTRVIHISYDAQRGATAFTTGPWQILNATLFDPILPFILGGNREGTDPEWKKNHLPTRVITGTATRLSGKEVGGSQIKLAHHGNHQIDLGGNNIVGLSYWVLTRPDGAATSSDVARSYVDAGTAVCMTLFGQRQDAMPRTWIKDKARLPFLFKNMIVQIDTDRLTARAKRELFTSTRERATESDLKHRIYEEVADILNLDETLSILNREEKERLLRKSSAATNEKVRRRLANFVKTKLKDAQRIGLGGTSRGNGGAPKKPVGGVPAAPRDISDKHLPSSPTRLVFEKRRSTVQQGRKTSVWVEINAKNGYLPAHDDDLSITWESLAQEGQLRVASRSALGGGKSSWQIASSPDAPTGEYKLTAQLITPTGFVLVDTLIVAVTPAVESPKDSPTVEPESGPDVRWVREEDWEEYGFSERSVGSVSVDEESTIIWVNRDYRLLKQALSGRSLTGDAIAIRADRYQFPVACAIWLQDYEAKRLTPEARPSDEYQMGELERLAEAVLLASDPDVALADEAAPEDE